MSAEPAGGVAGTGPPSRCRWPIAVSETESGVAALTLSARALLGVIMGVGGSTGGVSPLRE
eukprot:3936398-Rhodomonas_salina.1